MENPSQENFDNWRKDSNNWKYGLFYHNKLDSRLFVDKKNPNLGATINFAHPKSYFIFIGIIAFITLIIIATNSVSK